MNVFHLLFLNVIRSLLSDQMVLSACSLSAARDVCALSFAGFVCVARRYSYAAVADLTCRTSID
jgi:hypothetical protein